MDRPQVTRIRWAWFWALLAMNAFLTALASVVSGWVARPTRPAPGIGHLVNVPKVLPGMVGTIYFSPENLVRIAALLVALAAILCLRRIGPRAPGLVANVMAEGLLRRIAVVGVLANILATRVIDSWWLLGAQLVFAAAIAAYVGRRKPQP
ncbi:MAG: hypothetical protein JSR45_09770 [Proteobacteria bacterium]|nr:hypothetical protein [Pseudomonadota bacterium]